MSPTSMVSPSRAGASLKESSDIAELAGGRTKTTHRIRGRFAAFDERSP